MRDLTRFTYFRGRVALAAILRALGIRAGDEVLIQAFTCVAVPEAIMSIGSRPVYVDTAEHGLNMDPSDLASKLTGSTKAVVVQHSFGLPADIVRIAEIARSRGVHLIEDCAHTISSTVDGRLVGSFGAAAFYSYEAAKPVFAGIGGSAISNDLELTRRLERDYATYEEPPTVSQIETGAMVHAHRLAYRPSTYWPVRSLFRTFSKLGIIRGNYNKLSHSAPPAADFARRMGRIQRNRLAQELKTIERQTAHRRQVALEYRTRIEARGIVHPPIPSNVDPVFSRYPILAEDKRAVLEDARRARVELAAFYDSPVQPLYGDALRSVGYEPGSCPNAEWAAERVVSLPTSLTVGKVEMDRAIAFLNERASGAP